MQWRGGPAAPMASLMSLFAHASGTDSSASHSDTGDYYYEQFNATCAASLPDEDFQFRLYVALFIVWSTTLMMSWKCARRHYDANTFILARESCADPAAAPDAAEISGQEGLEDEEEDIVRLVPRVLDECNTSCMGPSGAPHTRHAHVHVQTESQRERHDFASHLFRQQRGGYTSPGGSKIHLSSTCIQQCSPLGQAAIFQYRDWCKLCSGPGVCHFTGKD
jgi:hypothetical protein